MNRLALLVVCALGVGMVALIVQQANVSGSASASVDAGGVPAGFIPTGTPTPADFPSPPTGTPTPADFPSPPTGTPTPAAFPPTHTPDGVCADVTGDGQVTFRDLVAVLMRFGAREGGRRYSPQYDLNGDGRINFQDVVIVWSQLGEAC